MGMEQKDKGNLLFHNKKENLSKTIKWLGPPLTAKPHVAKFKKKHKKTFTQGKIIAANVKRKFMIPEELINDLKKDDYVKEKVKKLEMKK